jgi:pyrroline-5-carboxylate reductase
MISTSEERKKLEKAMKQKICSRGGTTEQTGNDLDQGEAENLEEHGA